MTKRKVILIATPDVETRPVVGYEGLYEVTRDGQVWSVAKDMGVSRHGGRWLKHAISTTGYPMVALFKDKKQRIHRVHRLVGEAWIPNPRNLPDINHLNGIKVDNRDLNLQWCTRAENNQHAIDLRLRSPGQLPDDIVRSVRALVRAGTKQKDVAARYQLHRSTVCQIAKGQIYRQVPAIVSQA